MTFDTRISLRDYFYREEDDLKARFCSDSDSSYVHVAFFMVIRSRCVRSERTYVNIIKACLITRMYMKEKQEVLGQILREGPI